MQPSFDAVARTSRVRSRLSVDAAPKSKDEVDWAEVSSAIHDAFAQLEHDLRARDTSIECNRGRTSGGVIESFNFCAIRLPSRPNAEAIVASVTFQRKGASLQLSADVSGEESGRIYVEEEPRRIDAERTTLLANAAVDLIEHLGRSADQIVDAVHRSLEV